MNRAERRRKEREERKKNFDCKKVFTFEDLFSDGGKSLEKVFTCDKCGATKDIEYTEMAIIKAIECDCGNIGVVQVHKGSITWKMPSDALNEALKENV